MPFLTTLTLIVATPLELVFALKVFLLILIVMVLPATVLPLDFKVTLIFLAFLTFKVAFLAVKVVAFLLTTTLLVPIDPLYVSSPRNDTTTLYVPALAYLTLMLAIPLLLVVPL